MTGRLRKGRAIAGNLVLALSALADSAAAAQTGASLEPSARVRPVDTRAAALVAAGIARSPTFRSLVEALEHSDLIVYVEIRPLRIPGQMQLVASTPECRYLRVSVRTPGLDNHLVAWLAHELMHAVEVSRAPDVLDELGLRRLYDQIGRTGRYGNEAESAAAQQTWTTVLREMQNAR